MLVEFERALGAVLPVAGRTSLTLTEVPARQEVLLQLLETAMTSGQAKHAMLKEVQLPMRAFPAIGNMFSKCPVTDSGSDILRFVFEGAPEYSI